LLLSRAIVEAKARIDYIQDDFDASEFACGWAEGAHWVLGMLADCDDLEIEELTD
jgi:hypothetical protein